MAFGGGVTGSVFSPVAMAAILLAGILMLVLPREKAIIPFFAGAILIPIDQILLIGPLHFPMLRVLLIFGFARMFWAKLSGTDPIFSGGMNAIDKASGRIRFLNKQPTSGNNSTHLTPDPSNRYLVIGNGPGVAVFPFNPDGSLAPFSDMVPAGGEIGPHRNQTGAGPHPHYVSFDPSGHFLVAPDRGVDRIHIYRLDASTGKLAANDPGFARTRPGAGPRHLAFHPAKPWAYVCDELDSTVTAYAWDSERGALKALQVISTLPESYIGRNEPAEIQVAPSGRFVYVSNRGHDSIVSYSVDPATGTLAPVGWEPTQGHAPRFFTLDPTGGLLYAANLESHDIVAFRVDQTSGKLTPTGLVVPTGSPSCIIFARA